MKLLGGSTLLLIGCATSDGTEGVDADGLPSTGGASDAGTGGADGSTAASSCSAAPDETIGPYPDKTGMLTDAAYNRRDITEGKAGLVLNVVLSIADTKAGCAAIPGAAVIIWQRDAEGHYSEYGGQPGGYDGTGATYLRGVQTADANGPVTFKTVYPAGTRGARRTSTSRCSSAATRRRSPSSPSRRASPRPSTAPASTPPRGRTRRPTRTTWCSPTACRVSSRPSPATRPAATRPP